jgi:parallel beta-helix repeat protein
MQNSLLKKVLICGIIYLFVGAAVIPIINGVNEKKFTGVNQTTYIKILYVGGSGPGNYSEIQYAIDNASSHTTILVYPGKYKNINFNNKSNIIIKGRDKTDVDDIQIDGENKDMINTVDITNSQSITIANFTITGSGLNYDDSSYKCDGIRCNSVSNIIIENNTIRENGNGIYVFNVPYSSNTYIKNNIVEYNMDNGVRFNNVRGLFILNNSILSNGYGPDTVSKNGDGIEAMSGSGIISIFNNTISNNMVDGIWIETGDKNSIKYNTIFGNQQHGIDLKEVSYTDISGNAIGGSRGERLSSGIYLWGGSFQNTISRNTIYNNNVGINFYDATNNLVNNINIIRKNYLAGLEFYKSSGNQIKQNVIQYNNISLIIFSSNGLNINYNDIYTNYGWNLFSVMAMGDASLNYWGVAGRPYSTLIRIPPLPFFPLISPWSPIPFFPEYKNMSTK